MNEKNMTYQESGTHRFRHGEQVSGITRNKAVTSDKFKVTSEKKVTTQESRGHGITRRNKKN